jgi:hypothetical protein
MTFLLLTVQCSLADPSIGLHGADRKGSSPPCPFCRLLEPGVTPYAQLMGQGDVPTSPGGPLRRRRDKRQLEQLADNSERDVNPGAAKGHVRVIEDQSAVKDRESEDQEADAQDELSVESRPGGFHVRPVPIDQPFNEA